MRVIRDNLKDTGKTVVFTNGCFDLLHAGHVDYLNKAKSFGDVLIVGINSDLSMKNIKGDKRPIIKENERSFIISNLVCVDYALLFDDDTPEKLINELAPDILVKGADWSKEHIVGSSYVESYGGKVERVEFVNDQSTSNIIKLIVERYK
ncbi:D-glycero-beta-D-manno-heptose 1-phosphate adenylyltransferase [Bacteroidota bacterium]